jgi:sulfate adenylyltransferase large subunit
MDINKYLNEHENKDLLRFLTCGSVDDGKSTLIGRMLYDSKLIFEDQLGALKKDSKNSGNTGEEEIDYSMLLDGLKAEREQGITIDVAYRYFSTPKRKFIIADTPGHEQYTRNMATGASTADLAIILIDARYGVITQTRRHAFIVSLLGIKHLVVAVNKMDLVDFSQEVFETIRSDFSEFVSDMNFPDVKFIPASALKGDNVVDKSDKTPWYKGKPLLQVLEDVDVTTDRNFADFRFPVQYVNRPNLDFRGFAGTVISGIIRKGDRITALPSRRQSTVKRIVTADGDLDEAFPPQAVTLTLEDEIDISSGDMIVHSDNLPRVHNRFQALVIWMSEKSAVTGGRYVIRHCSHQVKAVVDSIEYKIDVNTLEQSESGELALNEIGQLTIATTLPIFYDPYSRNRNTGSFILIDPISNVTVGAGMIVDGLSDDIGSDNSRERHSNLLQEHVEKREHEWDTGLVSPLDRIVRNRHRGKAIIVTGKNGSNQRDIAKHLERELFRINMNAYYLGASNLLGGLDADLGNSFLEHGEHVRRLGELARILTDAGMIFISAVDDINDYDLEQLRILNYPNELLIVSVGESTLKKHHPDVELTENPNAEDSLKAILKELSSKKVIPDYCI